MRGEKIIKEIGVYVVAVVIGVITSFMLFFGVTRFLMEKFPGNLIGIIILFEIFVVPFVLSFAILYRSNKELRWAILGGLISLVITFLVFLVLVARAMARYGFP